jgi:hypothetical protein
MYKFARLALSACLTVCASVALANPKADLATLSFSDGRPSLVDTAAINTVLRGVGVHVGRVELPERALPILKASAASKLNEKQTADLLEIFALSREQLLGKVQVAGRTPVISGGGSLISGEAGVAPYPKVYDMMSMGPDDKKFVQNKFGKLHVNSADSGEGVDEVMSLVSGGPWTWYFALKDNVVVKLALSRVRPQGPGWRLSYPGLTPHGAFMDAADGVVIAHIYGPKTWVMRYEAPGAAPGLLGGNPWIDASTGKAK